MQESTSQTPPPLPICIIACEQLESGPEHAAKPQVIEFAAPQRLRQIRLPRSSCIVHYKLKKYENQFISNNFWLEIFGLDVSTNKFRLLFAETVNTDKSIKELLIPLTGDTLYHSLVFKGDFQNTLVVVYADNDGQAAQPSSPDGQPEPGALANNDPAPTPHDDLGPNLLDSGRSDPTPQNNYNVVNEISKKNESFAEADEPQGPEGEAPQLPGGFRFQEVYKWAAFTDEELAATAAKMVPQPLRAPNCTSITPSLIFGTNKEPEEGDDKEYPEMLLVPELDDLANYLTSTIQTPRDKLTQQEIMVYFGSLTDAIAKLRAFVEAHKSSIYKPFFFETQVVQNKKLNPGFCGLARAAIQGKIGNENERILGQMLLSCLANSKEHVEKLADWEFISSFLEASFREPTGGARLLGLFFENFWKLCYHRKFREALASRETDEGLRREFEVELPSAGGRSSRREKERLRDAGSVRELPKEREREGDRRGDAKQDKDKSPRGNSAADGQSRFNDPSLGSARDKPDTPLNQSAREDDRRPPKGQAQPPSVRQPDKSKPQSMVP
jgi:hypothetical protein